MQRVTLSSTTSSSLLTVGTFPSSATSTPPLTFGTAGVGGDLGGVGERGGGAP